MFADQSEKAEKLVAELGILARAQELGAGEDDIWGTDGECAAGRAGVSSDLRAVFGSRAGCQRERRIVTPTAAALFTAPGFRKVISTDWTRSGSMHISATRDARASTSR